MLNERRGNFLGVHDRKKVKIPRKIHCTFVKNKEYALEVDTDISFFVVDRIRCSVVQAPSVHLRIDWFCR